MAREDTIRHEGEAVAGAARQAVAWPRVQAVLQAAWTHSAEFRSRMAGAGLAMQDIRSWEDFVRIPPIRKKALMDWQQREGLGSLTSVELGRLSRIFMSPGPLFDPEGRSADFWGWTDAFHAAGFRAGDVVQMTFGYHLTPAGLMLEEPLRELGCAVIPAGPGNTQTQIDLLTRLPVTGFVGMASYLKVIKDTARAQGVDLATAFQLKVAFVAAERLPEALRQELEAELGLLVRQGYGTADVGCIAYECRQLAGMHLACRAHVEICDPATGAPLPAGETGEVVVTPFPLEYPLVRLATGDLSRLEDSPCACGRGAPRLLGILGRVDDTAKVKGQFIYPHQVAQALAGYPEIVRWQVVVENPGGKDCLTLVLAGPADTALDAVAASFTTQCKLRPQIRLLAPDACGEELPEHAPRLVDKRSW
ncbi:phenylacetate--CoA ligase family protein [Megalodesulfovibrio paquesii]